MARRHLRHQRLRLAECVAHHDRDVQLAIDQQVLQERRRVFHHLQIHAGASAAKTREHLGEVVARHQTRHADGESARQRRGAGVHAARGVGHRTDHTARLHQKTVALGRQAHALGAALEQHQGQHRDRHADGQGDEKDAKNETDDAQGRKGHDVGLGSQGTGAPFYSRGGRCKSELCRGRLGCWLDLPARAAA